MGKCDFCSAPDPPWTHPSADFVMEDEGWGSADNAWSACETCHALIMAEERDKLVSRAVRTFFTTQQIPMDARLMQEVRKKVRRMHAGFWANRNGEPYQENPKRGFLWQQ